MRLDPRKSPVVFSLLMACCALVVFGSLHWFWLTSQYSGSGPRHITLWGEVGRLILDLQHTERTSGWLLDTLWAYRRTLGLAGMIFASGGALGRAYYWWRCERGRPERSEV
jgi:hypothetical protein